MGIFVSCGSHSLNLVVNDAALSHSFKFLYCVVTWHEVLFKINTVNKVLQNVTSDLQSSMGLIKSFLENMRSDDGFNSIITDARELAEKIGVITDFEKEVQVYPRKVKRQFSYESDDQLG